MVKGTTIHETAFVHPSSIIGPNVIIGADVYIGPNCVIGATGEHKLHWHEEGKGVVIEAETVITGGVYIDSGVERATRIGKGCFIMKMAYIAHDCILGDLVTISAGVKLAGFVTVGFRTNIGMGVAVHQKVTIPEYCMLGMNATITKKTELKENHKYVGTPARSIGINIKE